jgi:hypothetical protein
MTRSVTIRIGEFAYEAISGDEGAPSERIPSRAAQAIRCYLNDKSLSRPGWLYPSRLLDGDQGEEVELQLNIDDDLWRSLEDEAEKQHVPPRRLVEHAAFYFAAEVNAGRATRRILEDLDDA